MYVYFHAFGNADGIAGEGVFAASKINTAPDSAPPEPFVIGSGGSTFSFVGLVGSVLEFIAPVIKKEASETEYVASAAALSASAQPAPFMPSAGAFDLAKTPVKCEECNGRVGRLSKDKVNNYSGAYTRYEYPTNGIQSKGCFEKPAFT